MELINEIQKVNLKPIIENIVAHSNISIYFNEDYSVYNERPILTKTGEQDNSG